MVYQSFDNTKGKFEKLWVRINTDKNNIKVLTPISINIISSNALKKTTRFELDTNPVYYDFYNFTGVTYRSGGGNDPTPASAYIENPPGTWTFILPIFDYRVPAGNDPEDYSETDEWEFASSSGNIRQILRFPSISEKDIYNFNLLSYLYDEEGNEITSENFAQFSRWIKRENGMDFYYHAYFVIPDEKQLRLKAELVLINKQDYNTVPTTEIS